VSEPFLGEVRLFSFAFPPRNWALCNGQLLSISQNQALFSLLGTTYGGNGTTTFGLPDLRGRAPMHEGNLHTLGERSGEEGHTLITNEIPLHGHQLMASTSDADFPIGTNNVLAAPPGAQIYEGTPGAAMSASTVANAGSSQAHGNMQPSLVISFCIALAGIFPSRN
jgi:microcystin-dependent protein